MASDVVILTLNTRGRVMGDVNPSWQPQGSNYSTDFTIKPIAEALQRRRPTSGHRKNNPHPVHLAHLRRLTNEPVCTVKTSITQSTDYGVLADINAMSSMKAHYVIPPLPPSTFRRTTRFGCNAGKRIPATGIVPTSPETVPEPERLLPACEKQTTLMSTSHPFQFVPRRRRIAPPVADEGYIIADPFMHTGQSDVGISIPLAHSLTRRRRVSTAPKTTLQGSLTGARYMQEIIDIALIQHYDDYPLVTRPVYMHDDARPHRARQVPGFDGGAPPDPTRTITGRKKRKIPNMTKLYSGNLPGWMTAF